ncbi:UNVERIFIED_CONTAM: hypothetical protein HHA_453320 [Hammondia hammondi]|eukprot:XP_008886604.1 hypothetical protein HHA_453320 [Hammondia hammondi]
MQTDRERAETPRDAEETSPLPREINKEDKTKHSVTATTRLQESTGLEALQVFELKKTLLGDTEKRLSQDGVAGQQKGGDFQREMWPF